MTLEQFMARVDQQPNGGCWLWRGQIARNGYGQFSRNRRTVMAHRFSYEQTIADGLATFQKVGDALISIRDEKLYRAEFDTFELYCQRKWKFSDRRARQLMTAAEIGTMVPVENERQARALAPIKDDPDALREVVKRAEHDGDKSASNLSKYVKHLKNVEGTGFDSSSPGATGDSPSVAEGERPNSRVDHGAGLGDPAASAASSTQVEVIDAPCPYCNGTGRYSPSDEKAS